ncbi:unnamed protein product, partial [Amoebophrya sp. A25]|eukprot:GSA25T00016972001.1
MLTTSVSDQDGKEMKDHDDLQMTSRRPPNNRMTQEEQKQSHNFITGATYFRQEPDSSSSRGASQRAVVVVTDHEDWRFVDLLKQIAYVLGPLYFDNGLKVLETAWYLINFEWPDLRTILLSG